MTAANIVALHKRAHALESAYDDLADETVGEELIWVRRACLKCWCW